MDDGSDSADESGPVVKSRCAHHYSYVRFWNKTSRNVDVVWINYQGRVQNVRG